MAPTLNCNHEAPYVAHSLRGEGFDASEDGTGRGTPLAPVAFDTYNQNVTGDVTQTLCSRGDSPGGNQHLVPAIVFDTTQITSGANRSNPKAGNPCHPLTAGAKAPAIAFPANLSGTQCASTEELAPSMGAKNPTGVAYTTKLHNTGSNNAGKIFEERTTCLDANSPPPVLLTTMAIRRLLPEECEKLQGFEPGYTAIPWRGKPADQCPDGPRYKALGNSMAVPVMRWIGRSIDYAMLWSTP